MKKIISLDGDWDFCLPADNYENISKTKMRVPSSYHCVGDAYFYYNLDIKKENDKIYYLVFEGVNNEALLFLNNKQILSMLPFCEYRINITDLLLGDSSNIIKLIVSDINAKFGPTWGWENYGGITRSVHLEICEKVLLSDYNFTYSFSENYKNAFCKLGLDIENYNTQNQECSCNIKLFYNNELKFSENKKISIAEKINKTETDFIIDYPVLWSPALPCLYLLVIELLDINNNIIDIIEKNAGFKDFKVIGEYFYLNGERCFLSGVCRHEMWGEHQGYSLTKQQIEHDLNLIKRMGANYIRLVHYPHNKYTMEYADKIGLMVSAEPGLWQADLNNSYISESALEIMRRTVIRDRNNICVAFWFIFNECSMNLDFMKACAELCRKLDPNRPVSAANCYPAADAKTAFDECNLDFYTFHAYGHTPDVLFDNSNLRFVMDTMKGKPIVFSEWGGWFLQNNKNLYEMTRREYMYYAQKRNLCGLAWWCWQDMYQYRRSFPGSYDGVLHDGLVDIDRNIKPMYNIMQQFFDGINSVIKINPDEKFNPYPYTYPYAFQPKIKIYPYKTENGNYKTISLDQIKKYKQQKKAVNFMIANAEVSNRFGNVEGAVISETISALGNLPSDIKKGYPIVLNGECSEIEININETAEKVYFIGQTTFPQGYPYKGLFGEEVASYILYYDDGSEEMIKMKNGLDYCASSMLAISSRIDPRAFNTCRVIETELEPDWEKYQVCLYEINTKNVRLNKIKFVLDNNSYIPLLYGITVKLK